MSVAFLYPGQGSQRAGMGRPLRTSDPELFDRYLDLAGDVSELPLRWLCLEGSDDELTRTEVSQPALFALSLALTEVAREHGIVPSLVAGHSLGELTAAVVAGALSVEDGMRFVALRGRLMAAIQAERPGAMAAVVGLVEGEVAALCRRVDRVVVANHNGLRQTVVSGDRDAVDALGALADAAGGRSVRLPVGGAFHSPAMEPLRVALASFSRQITWRDARLPLASNAVGGLLIDADRIRAAVIAQVAAPVRWVECMEALVAGGAVRFLELGPGRVLTGLVRSFRRDLAAAAADSRAKLVAFSHPKQLERTR